MDENITDAGQAIEEITVLQERIGHLRTAEPVPTDAKIHLDAVYHHLDRAEAVLRLDRAGSMDDYE